MTDLHAERLERALEIFPPHKQEIAIAVADTVRFGWIVAQRVFGDAARTDHAMQIAELLLNSFAHAEHKSMPNEMHVLFKQLVDQAAAFLPLAKSADLPTDPASFGTKPQ